MSSGGQSFKRKDWLKVAGGLALGATGLGAAGIGPLAGPMASLLGGGGSIGGAALGAAPGEAIGAFTGSATGPGLLGSATKGLEAFGKAQKLMQLAQGPEQQQPQAAQRPQAAPVPTMTAELERLKKLYGIA